MARTRGRGRRSSASSCKSMMCGDAGGVMRTLGSEEVMAMGGQTTKCPTATCPAYTGIVVFVGCLYLFFLAVNWTFRPGFMRKAGSSPTDANNISTTSGALYALLWTGLVLLAIGLILRCRACV